MTDVELAERISGDNIDILVDMNGMVGWLLLTGTKHWMTEWLVGW